MKTLAIAALVVLSMASLAHAGSIATLTGSVNATRWFVWAQVDTVANDGLAIIDIEVGNVITSPKPINKAPNAADFNDTGDQVGLYGFNYGNAVNVIDTNVVEVIAGMNPDIAATPYDLHYLGQQTVTFESVGVDGCTVINHTIPAKVLIAQGTYNPAMGLPRFTQTQAVDVWGVGTNDMLALDGGPNGHSS